MRVRDYHNNDNSDAKVHNEWNLFYAGSWRFYDADADAERSVSYSKKFLIEKLCAATFYHAHVSLEWINDERHRAKTLKRTDSSIIHS